MKYSLLIKRRRHQRGVAAVELAVFLFLLTLLLTVPLFFGRFFWHYSVAQKAAHDAARYLASIPRAEMLAKKSPLGEIEAARFARAIAAIETEELNPGPGGVLIDINCNNVTCHGLVVPATVRAAVTIEVTDTFFVGLTDQFGAGGGRGFTVDVSLPYAGQ